MRRATIFGVAGVTAVVGFGLALVMSWKGIIPVRGTIAPTSCNVKKLEVGVLIRHGQGAPEGVMLSLGNSASASDWMKIVYGGTQGGTDASGQSTFTLEQGWVYVNGKFPMMRSANSTVSKEWVRWPIITSHTIKIGADGTKFAVWSEQVSTSFKQRVYCFDGTASVWVDDPSKPTLVPAGNFVEVVTIMGAVNSSTTIGPVKPTPDIQTVPNDEVAKQVDDIKKTASMSPFNATTP